MKTVRKTSLPFFKVHSSSFVTRFYCIKPTHLSVLRFSGSFDTHYKGRILPQFYIQLVHFGLFLAVSAAQGSMEKRLSLSYLLLRAKKCYFLKMLLITSALKSCLTCILSEKKNVQLYRPTVYTSEEGTIVPKSLHIIRSGGPV